MVKDEEQQLRVSIVILREEKKKQIFYHLTVTLLVKGLCSNRLLFPNVLCLSRATW